MRGGLQRAALLLAWLPSALALNPALDVSQYAHTVWRLREGFTKGSIAAIAQTADGYLWLGTTAGLYRFDGVRNVLWQPPSYPQLPSSRIRSLLAARDGTLWIGCDNGLASWKGGKLTTVTELSGKIIFTLLEDREGVIWAGAGDVPTGRLCAIRNGSVRCFGEDGAFGRGVVSLYEHAGAIWAGAGTGLWRWEPERQRVYQMPDRPTDISTMIEGDDGALWFATGSGIKEVRKGRVGQHALPISAQSRVQRSLRDRDGALWIGTATQGLLHMNRQRSDVFSSVDGLSGDHIRALFEDREGTLWVATSDGLDRFRHFAIPTISVRQGLAASTVTAVLGARDGAVWISTSGGLSKWTKGEFTTYRQPVGRLPSGSARRTAREIDNGLPGNAPQSLFEDTRGRIWVATERGFGYFESGRFSLTGVPAGISRSIAADDLGNVWSADLNRGLIHLSPSGGVSQLPWSRLGHKDFATRLLFDAGRKGLWLGFFQGGIAFLKDGQVRRSYTSADGLGGGLVNDLRLDPDGTLWVATEGGLSRFRNGRIDTLSRKSGLPCDGVNWAIEDNARSLWLYSPCGLVRVTRPEWDAWARDPHHTIQTAVFDASDGVMTLSGPGGFKPQAGKSSDGKIWFVTPDGVGVIDPGNLPSNGLPPPARIEQITADRRVYEASGPLRLAPLLRDLKIDYTALSLVVPEKVRFRYKLEGKDTDWQDAEDRRQAFYNDLPPRRYRFRVTASNNSGVWNEAGASFEFSIAPAYYQSAWFRAVCGAAFLALLGGLYHLRLRHLAWRYKARLEGRLAERNRVAQDLHDTLLQGMLSASMHVDLAADMLPEDSPAKPTLTRGLELMRQVIDEGRKALQGLRSSDSPSLDLAEAFALVQDEVVAQSTTCELTDFRVVVEGEQRPLCPLLRDEMYRIGREALINAFRHSRAKHIEVRLQYFPNELRILVKDDGCGIDPSLVAVGRDGHWGLAGMRERAEQIGAQLHLSTRAMVGTAVEVSAPGPKVFLDHGKARWWQGRRACAEDADRVR